jgi:hypothetical protein
MRRFLGVARNEVKGAWVRLASKTAPIVKDGFDSRYNPVTGTQMLTLLATSVLPLSADDMSTNRLYSKQRRHFHHEPFVPAFRTPRNT